MSDPETADRQSTLSARIVWHELMLALLVAMQAIDLYWASGDGVSIVLVYGFGVLAAVLWVRFLALHVGPGFRRAIGEEVN